MGRQLRSKRAGEIKKMTQNTTGQSSPTISNYGVTVLSATTTAPYILDKPEEGTRVTLIDNTTVGAKVVRATTIGDATSVTIGSGSAYQITFTSTVAQAITLVGVSTARWCVESIYPTSGALAPTVGTS